MRFVAPVLAFLAAVATAQNNNAISVPPGGLIVSADVPTTITWINPSSGTVTIKLQQGSVITPDSGLTVASGIEASALTATFSIPAAKVNSAQYVFEIIDDLDPTNYNFSPGFTVAGATMIGTTTISSASATDSITSSATSGTSDTTTSSTSSGITSGTSSITSVTLPVTTSSPTLTSSAVLSSLTPASSSSSGISTITISTYSATQSAEPTSVTNNNGAASLHYQGGLLAMIVGVIAVF